MAAIGSLNQELQADLANPNGQINSAISSANQQPQLSNNNGE
jgi:hypothetical protein